MPDLSQLPIPYGIDWDRWVGSVIGLNPSLNNSVPYSQNWRDFANRLIQVGFNAPRPDTFTDWREWASRLKSSYPN